MSALAGNAEEDLAPGSNPTRRPSCGRTGAFTRGTCPKEGRGAQKRKRRSESLAAEFAEEDGCDEEDQDIE